MHTQYTGFQATRNYAKYCQSDECYNQPRNSRAYYCDECHRDRNGCRFCGSLNLAPGITTRMSWRKRVCISPLCAALYRITRKTARAGLMLGISERVNQPVRIRALAIARDELSLAEQYMVIIRLTLRNINEFRALCQILFRLES